MVSDKIRNRALCEYKMVFVLSHLRAQMHEPQQVYQELFSLFEDNNIRWQLLGCTYPGHIPARLHLSFLKLTLNVFCQQVDSNQVL